VFLPKIVGSVAFIIDKKKKKKKKERKISIVGSGESDE
jgi:hypothetical protein